MNKEKDLDSQLVEMIYETVNKSDIGEKQLVVLSRKLQMCVDSYRR
jgi:hypothetical protein